MHRPINEHPEQIGDIEEAQVLRPVGSSARRVSRSFVRGDRCRFRSAGRGSRATGVSARDRAELTKR